MNGAAITLVKKVEELEDGEIVNIHNVRVRAMHASVTIGRYDAMLCVTNRSMRYCIIGRTVVLTCGFPSRVLANRHIQSACSELVIHIF